MILVGCMDRAKLGGEAHDTRGATARSLDWNSGNDADDGTDALSYYDFNEWGWRLEVLRH